MFSKVPRQSYTSLPRVQSARGLLSTMFHPPAEFFPEDHPYRRSLSTHDILAQAPRAFHPLNSGIAASKSAAAIPVAATVTAAIPPQAAPVCSPNRTRRSPLRLKGRQADAELEDESGDEDDQNKLHVSTSVAEQRLAELQQKQTTRRASMHQEQQQQPVGGLAQQAQQQRHRARFNVPPESSRAGPSQFQQPPARAPVVPVPITAIFPYNLPEAQPPTTPRTTRRNFLANELSESLRRNMLWERQISRQRPLRRTMTVANGIANANAVGANGMVNGVVGAGAAGGRPPLNATRSDETGQQQQQQLQLDPAARQLDERRRAAIARNRSWAGEFHAAGW